MVDTYERCKTGILGLDSLIEGGFPVGRSMLVSGGCGTGKTILAMQYIYSGANDYNEPGVFVTLDESPAMIRKDMMRFGWDLAKLEKRGVLAIVDASSARVGFPSEEKYTLPQMGVDVDRLLLKVMQLCDQIGAKRVVIDSVAGLGLHIDSENEVRKTLLKINYMLSKAGVTSLITSEVPEQSMSSGPVVFSKYGVEEYMADGVIILHYMGIGSESNRTMFVRKMRGTKHVEDILPMEITPKGIVVKKPQEEYRI
ncbi:MAG: ATPase domain-containing protein [Candidatus Micrarchaeota archaeon]